LPRDAREGRLVVCRYLREQIMVTSTIDEAQSQLARLIGLAERGEEIVIAREGKCGDGYRTAAPGRDYFFGPAGTGCAWGALGGASASRTERSA
jgi:hypothetical protein